MSTFVQCSKIVRTTEKKGERKKTSFQTFSLTFPQIERMFLFVWCVSYLDTDAECDVHLNLSFDKGGKGVLTLGTGLGLFGCKQMQLSPRLH